MKNTNETNIWQGLAVGAVAGLVGALAMDQFQWLLSSLSESDQQPSEAQSEQQKEENEDATVKMAQAISRNVFEHDLTDEEKKWAGPAVHYSFGASMGALYGALTESSPGASAGLGTAYGTALWAVADELAVPAFGLSKPIPETELSSHARALASHWVYGLATDLTRRGILKLTCGYE